jgi:ribosomal protein S18 acetylase RimI-like enzyme
LIGIQRDETEFAADRAPADPAYARAYLAWLDGRCRTRRGRFVLAEAEGAPIGFVAYWIDVDDGPLLARKWRRQGYISDLYVEPAWRRRGIAAALMERAERYFARLGLRRVMIHALGANRPALALYRKRGFETYVVGLTKPLKS